MSKKARQKYVCKLTKLFISGQVLIKTIRASSDIEIADAIRALKFADIATHYTGV